MTPTAETRTVLYTGDELNDVLDQMAADLASLLRPSTHVTLVGVLRRGAPLSDLLRERLTVRLPALAVERLDLAIKRYADDLSLLHPQTQLTEKPEHAGIDLSGRTVVVVDDLLYRGFSLNRAVEYLVAKGAERIISVVLADRVCAVLPLRADVAGLKLQVAPGRIVEFQVPPYEPTFQLVLVTGQAAPPA